MSIRITSVLMALALAISAISVTASGVKYVDGDKYAELGALIQLRYHSVDRDGGDSTDSLDFSHIRPYLNGAFSKDWMGRVQLELGNNNIELLDLYFAYMGKENCTIKLGNALFPFSAEVLTSPGEQQLIPFTFVGDPNYGAPARQTGVHIAGAAAEGKLSWGAALAKVAHDPNDDGLAFRSVASLNDEEDWGEGEMIGARLDFYPMGPMGRGQGAFNVKEPKATIGVAAFTWSNDGDVRRPLAATSNAIPMGFVTQDFDLDTATGFEVSAALRTGNFSGNAQFNSFDAELEDEGINRGIYRDSETTLENYALEGGYMVVPSKLEVVAGYQTQDADGYDETWNRASIGANFFIAQHDAKYQITYRMGENLHGVDGNDADEVFVQAQYAF